MLEIKNVSKVFNLDQPLENHKTALDDLSLCIQEGEFVTVIGGNGSGKTTMLNVIAGSIEVDKGTIWVGNVEITGMKEYQRAPLLGRVFQDPLMGTAAHMSIEENLSIASRKGKRNTLQWGFNKLESKRFKTMLSNLGLGLEDRLHQRMGLLSGGQRQAVTLLMATMQKPKVLLLDEHTAALDPKTAKTVLKLTDELVRSQQITTIMITHNMKDALKYGNRLLMFHQGKIILDIQKEEKAKLTIEDLLQKFEMHEDLEINDTLFLPKS